MRAIPIGLLTAALLSGATAQAGTFDEATGTVSTAGAAIEYGCDSLATLPATLTLTGYDPTSTPVDPATLEFIGADQSIEGHGAMQLGGPVMMLAFRFTKPEAFLGHRVRVVAWTRGARTSLLGGLRWLAPSWRGNMSIGQAELLPTGRRTDDGWIELSSGPVDFYLGARIAPIIEFVDVQYTLYNPFDGSPSVDHDDAARAELDALEIDDLGPSLVPDALCNVTTEAVDCGGEGLCYYGRCADAVAIEGPAPQGTLRDEYLSRREFEFEHFTGIRALDKIMPEFLARLDGLRGAPDKGFWTTITAAWHLGLDPHGRPPAMNSLDSPNGGMCTHLGEADLLPPDASGKPARAPLVFSVDTSFAPYASLLVGDALTAIDGVPVEQWKKLASRLFYTQGDPGGEAVLSAPELAGAAARAGSVLTFSRCPASIGATRACHASELVTVDVDLRDAFAAGLWSGFGMPSPWSGCDWRFRRLPSTDYVSQYTHAVSADDGDVRVVEFNGLPDEGSTPQWAQVMDSALMPDLGLFLIDERQGDGGYLSTVPDIASRFIPDSLPVSTDLFPRLERPLDLATAQRLLACASSPTEFDICYAGGTVIPIAAGGPSSGLLAGARVAVLTSMDVSCNDFVTRFITFHTGPTRIFGPGPTMGGFGDIFYVGSHLGEMSGGTFQMTDSDFHIGDLTSAPVLQSLTGVPPDEVAFQKQSDLLAGKDTLVDAAKAWLRQQ